MDPTPDDERSLKKICGDLVHEVADRAADKDNLNQARCGQWVQSVTAILCLELDQLEARRAARAEGGDLLMDPTPDLVTKQLEAATSPSQWLTKPMKLTPSYAQPTLRNSCTS